MWNGYLCEEYWVNTETGEGGGRGVRYGDTCIPMVYIHGDMNGSFMSTYGKNHYNIVK